MLLFSLQFVWSESSFRPLNGAHCPTEAVNPVLPGAFKCPEYHSVESRPVIISLKSSDGGLKLSSCTVEKRQMPPIWILIEEMDFEDVSWRGQVYSN